MIPKIWYPRAGRWPVRGLRGSGRSADSCTVKPGTKIFVAASSVECSTFEGNGTTEAELRACAEQKRGRGDQSNDNAV
jgi:hypothetical protein